MKNRPINKSRKWNLAALAAAMLISCITRAAEPAWDINYDFNAGAPAGTTLIGSAKMIGSGSFDGSGYLELTHNVNGVEGTIGIPDVTGGKDVTQFTALFKMYIGNGSGNAADGLSFNIAGDIDPAVTNVGEDGTGSGLSVDFDTYDNGGNEAPSIAVEWGGSDVASLNSAGTPPVTKSILVNSRWVDVAIQYDCDTATGVGHATVVHDNIIYFNKLEIPGCTAITAPKIAIGGRTGGENENQWIDNLRILYNAPFQIQLPPVLTSRIPVPGSSIGAPDLISATVKNQDLSVDPATLKLTLDGTAVAGTVTTTATGATVSFNPNSVVGSQHTLKVDFKDTQGNSYSDSWSYTVGPFTTHTLFIEAEDVDFADGQFVTDQKIGMDGPYPGGSYAGLGTAADLGIDWNTNDNAQQAYRPDTGIAAGKQKGSAGSDRGFFTVDDWWTVGWNDGGEWYNYTRVFPTPAKNYLVYGHLASGGAPINIQVDKVTAGVGQDDAAQVKELVGYFKPGRATAGWDSLEIFPLVDENGQQITVSLDGKTTLRATMAPGSAEDMDYFAFVPAVAPYVASSSATASGVVLTIKDVAGSPGADANTVAVTINGNTVTVTATKTGDTTTVNAAAELTPLSTIAVMVTFKDTTGTTYGQALNITIPYWSKDTLWIEAEDADFGVVQPDGTTVLHAQFVTDQKIGMDGPYDGGAYKGLGTADDQGFDWNAGDAAGQAYRPDTHLAAGKEGGSAGSDRGYFSVTDWWTLGWNDAGEWYNYTRVFPAQPKNYLVYGHLASGGAAIHIEVDQITDGVGQDDATQVKQLVGYFDPKRATAGWDSLEIFPLVDASGQPVLVKLSGKTTLRATMLPGSNEDMDFFAFTPVTALIPPRVTSTAPSGGGDLTDAGLAATIENQDLQVDVSSIKLSVDGTDAPTATVTPTANGATVAFKPDTSSWLLNSSHSASLTYKDKNGKSYTYTWSFMKPYWTKDTLWIEAEDADFGVSQADGSILHAQFVTDQKIGMDGPYPGGSYAGLGTADDANIDWHFGDNAAQPYRPDTALAAGKERGSAGNSRGYFNVDDWWTLGWNDGGEWANYTRAFPSPGKNYLVFGHLASGGAAIHIQVDQITDGIGKDDSEQVKQLVGYFDPKRPTAGWDSLEIFPLVDANGAPVTVKLGGKTTLRATMLPGSNEDIDFFAFTPVSVTLPPQVVDSFPKAGSTRGPRDIFKATIQNQDVNVDVGSIHLALNGNALSGVVVTGTPTGATISYKPSTLFDVGAKNTMTISFTAGGEAYSKDIIYTVGPLTTDTFIVEAEDFNYDAGKSNPKAGVTGKDVNVMPYLGGAYDTLAATSLVDYRNDDGNDSDVYRKGEDPNVNINDNSSDNERGGFLTSVNYKIGWVGSPDWQNYTRTLPASNYKVYAAISHGDPAGTANRLIGQLQLVTSDPGQPDQTVVDLGSFNAPSTGGWGLNALVPMTSSSGAPLVLHAEGTVTLRFVAQSGDFDFFALVPTSEPPSPASASANVGNGAPVFSGSFSSLGFTITDVGRVPVTQSSVHLTVDGTDVTSGIAFARTATGATVNYTPNGGFGAGNHDYTLSYGGQTLNGSFLVGLAVFDIEAEDFNYDGGKTNPKAGTAGLDVNVMPYLGGAYDGLGGVSGVDYVNDDGNDSDVYRKGENPNVNINDNIADHNRLAFDVTTNYKIGWIGSPDSQNYTRTFPKGEYAVFAAISHGDPAGTPDRLTGKLQLVTSDPAQPNQTVQDIGSFRAPSTGGWGSNALVPMRSSDTVTLDGTQTVRFVATSGDFDYLLFLKVGEGGVVGEIHIAISQNSDGSVQITWTGGGTLEAANDVTGPYTSTGDTSGSRKVSATDAHKFYRVNRTP